MPWKCNLGASRPVAHQLLALGGRDSILEGVPRCQSLTQEHEAKEREGKDAQTESRASRGAVFVGTKCLLNTDLEELSVIASGKSCTTPLGEYTPS